jgi:hypothetical protein
LVPQVGHTWLPPPLHGQGPWDETVTRHAPGPRAAAAEAGPPPRCRLLSAHDAQPGSGVARNPPSAPRPRLVPLVEPPMGQQRRQRAPLRHPTGGGRAPASGQDDARAQLAATPSPHAPVATACRHAMPPTAVVHRGTAALRVAGRDVVQLLAGGLFQLGQRHPRPAAQTESDAVGAEGRRAERTEALGASVLHDAVAHGGKPQGALAPGGVGEPPPPPGCRALGACCTGCTEPLPGRTGNRVNRLEGHAVHARGSLGGLPPWPGQEPAFPGAARLQAIGLCAAMRPRRLRHPVDAPRRGQRRGARCRRRVPPDRCGPWRPGQGAPLPAAAAAPAPRRFAVVPRPAFGAPGMEVAPEKHAHGNGPPSALPAAPAPGASGCGATFPRPLALSAVAVRRLTVGHAGVRSAGGHPPAVAFGSYLPYAAQAQTAVHVQGTFTPGARAHAGRTPDTAADGRDSGGANVIGTDAGGGGFAARR